MMNKAVAKASGSTCNLFVYGTLMNGQLVKALLNRLPKHQVAVLPNYRRRMLEYRVYPCVFPFPGSSVKGKLLLDITPDEKALLDAYEDEEYDCAEVMVEVQKPQVVSVPALAYVLAKNTESKPTDEDFDYDAFKKDFLPLYLKECAEFAQEWRSDQSCDAL